MAGNDGLAARVPTRLTASEGRRFAFPVGLAFLALAALVRWRGADTAAFVLAGTGAALLLAGLLVPARLGPVQRAWMGLAHAISRVTTPIVMGVLYFGVFTPAGVLARALGHRPLVRNGPSVWVERPPESRGSDLDRQF
jgi:hypothetical protein